MPPKALLFALATLSGCATVDQTAAKSAAASYASAKAPDAVTQCLSESLGFLVGGPVVSRSAAENRISFDTGGFAYLVISVRPAAAGSAVAVHTAGKFDNRTRRTVESCV